jgi:putative spermidine/putrescine transport system permease protein
MAFLALPLVRLIMGSIDSEAGWGIYLQILQKPRYLSALFQTVGVSVAVTFAALAISTTADFFWCATGFRAEVCCYPFSRFHWHFQAWLSAS